MDKNDYINNLKTTDLRPGKVKVEEKNETVLMESDSDRPDSPPELLLNEIFVKIGEVEKMPKGKDKDITMLRLSMIAELDASNLYERFAALADDERVKALMLDVSKEEKTHAGEFEAVMEHLDPEYEEQEEEGEEEVENLLGIKD